MLPILPRQHLDHLRRLFRTDAAFFVFEINESAPFIRLVRTNSVQRSMSPKRRGLLANCVDTLTGLLLIGGVFSYETPSPKLPQW